MEEIGQMNGELEKIIRNEYASALETVLLKTANVWKYVIYELCGEDFLHYGRSSIGERAIPSQMSSALHFFGLTRPAR